MKIEELERLGDFLEEPAHLLVWCKLDAFEVVAVKGDGWEDAFPLPMEVQAAAAEAELILDTTTVARLEIEGLPDDFWEELERSDYGVNLTVSVLGRSGAKYLEVFHAVSSGGYEGDFRLGEGELLRVARWIRERSVFDHRSGDALMEVFGKLRS